VSYHRERDAIAFCCVVNASRDNYGQRIKFVIRWKVLI